MGLLLMNLTQEEKAFVDPVLACILVSIFVFTAVMFLMCWREARMARRYYKRKEVNRHGKTSHRDR